MNVSCFCLLEMYDAESTTTKFAPVLFDGQNERSQNHGNRSAPLGGANPGTMLRYLLALLARLARTVGPARGAVTACCRRCDQHRANLANIGRAYSASFFSVRSRLRRLYTPCALTIFVRFDQFLLEDLNHMKRLNLRIALVIEETESLGRSVVQLLRSQGWIVHGIRRAELFVVLADCHCECETQQ